MVCSRTTTTLSLVASISNTFGMNSWLNRTSPVGTPVFFENTVMTLCSAAAAQPKCRGSVTSI